jgi:hypothetical protein
MLSIVYAGCHSYSVFIVMLDLIVLFMLRLAYAACHVSNMLSVVMSIFIILAVEAEA